MTHWRSGDMQEMGFYPRLTKHRKPHAHMAALHFIADTGSLVNRKGKSGGMELILKLSLQ